VHVVDFDFRRAQAAIKRLFPVPPSPNCDVPAMSYVLIMSHVAAGVMCRQWQGHCLTLASPRGGRTILIVQRVAASLAQITGFIFI
jgi:hypothetical protein